jgi:hypothetical protein
MTPNKGPPTAHTIPAARIAAMLLDGIAVAGTGHTAVTA